MKIIDSAKAALSKFKKQYQHPDDSGEAAVGELKINLLAIAIVIIVTLIAAAFG